MEWITKTEFSMRVSRTRNHVDDAVSKHIIDARATPNGGRRGGYRINWDTEGKKYLAWDLDAHLSNSEAWRPGDESEPPPMNVTNVDDTLCADEPPSIMSPPALPENQRVNAAVSDEALGDLLKSNISKDEAERIQKILKARRELLDYKHDQAELISVSDLVPQFQEIAVIVRKKMQSIPPRVAPLAAACDDHFKIKKMLEDEIDTALRSFNLFVKKLENGEITN
ncbi:MAG: hypothetical protein WC261_03405 [Synergistaceae bacterium]|jgi:hypothetical protein